MSKITAFDTTDLPLQCTILLFLQELPLPTTIHHSKNLVVCTKIPCPRWVNQGATYKYKACLDCRAPLTEDSCRQELLAWLNNLLQLNVTKVEQCGTGYGDRPVGESSGQRDSLT